jgi:hypothetical protein
MQEKPKLQKAEQTANIQDSVNVPLRRSIEKA